MKTVGIVGATSPLGIYLVDLMSRWNCKVYAGYRRYELVPLFWWKNKSIVCVKADIEERKSLISAFRGCETVVWLAHREQGRLNEREVELNVRPFKWFCDQLSQFGINKLVFISSGGSVYGEPTILPILEDHPRNPLSSYGKAKKHMEDVLHFYGNRMDFDIAILRPGNIYGPELLNGRTKGIISAFFRSLFFGQPFTLIGDGKAIRDFVYVYDVVRAILYAIESKQRKILWNVGTGIGYSVADVIQLISQAMSYRKPHVIYQAAYNTDVTKNILSIKRIRMECGWKPEISIEQGIQELAKLCKRQIK